MGYIQPSDFINLGKVNEYVTICENKAYNQALEDFSKKMKEVNLTNSFVLYYGDEIDLEEFMNLASDEIKEQLMK